MVEFMSPEWFRVAWQVLAVSAPILFWGGFVYAALTTPLPERRKGRKA